MVTLRNFILVMTPDMTPEEDAADENAAESKTRLDPDESTERKEPGSEPLAGGQLDHLRDEHHGNGGGTHQIEANDSLG